MDRVLCVEDSQEYQIVIKRALSGITADFASNLAEARFLLDSPDKTYDMLLLDVSLPDGDGIKFLSEFNLNNKKTRDIPVFIVSSDTNELSKVTAFGLGVDDYICKPFSPIELKARVDAKIKKAKDKKIESNNYLVGNVEVDQSKMTLKVRGSLTPVQNITPIEFKIFTLLGQSPGNIMSRAQIIDRVWPMNTFITERTVDAHVSHLRKKMAGADIEIETVFGVGYKLVIK
jgi:DNA-binding response OmpR family regulator